MRKLAIVSTLVLSTVAMTVSAADARPWGGRGYYGGYGHRGGIGRGAAVGLGIAGLAAGAVAAGAANSYYNGGNYGRPYGAYGSPYGYGGGGYYGYGY